MPCQFDKFDNIIKKKSRNTIKTWLCRQLMWQPWSDATQYMSHCGTLNLKKALAFSECVFIFSLHFLKSPWKCERFFLFTSIWPRNDCIVWMYGFSRFWAIQGFDYRAIFHISFIWKILKPFKDTPLLLLPKNEWAFFSKMHVIIFSCKICNRKVLLVHFF